MVHTGTFVVESRSGAAPDLVAERPAPGARTVTTYRVSGSAIVLGSTQSAGDFDPDSASSSAMVICRRRGGGGAVALAPDSQVWLEVFVPTGDALWHADVNRSAWWLGDSLAAAVQDLSGAPATAHKGPLVSTRWSRKLCFAGLGPGEVTIDGLKVAGLSQRRDRHGTRLAVALLLETGPQIALADLLAIDPMAQKEAAIELGGSIRGISATVDEAEEAVLRRLREIA
ncbi:MAG TPA: hypothetical protein VGS21_04880 [Acidimicrobiales bacterium]|nr:hypothetical protein [Acidimicrobiales bacterium]